MRTRKERLQERGWTVLAEKNDQIFVADDKHNHRWVLRFRGGNHPLIPRTVDAYYPSIADEDTRIKLANDPQAIIDAWNIDGTHSGSFFRIWTVQEAELTSGALEELMNPSSKMISSLPELVGLPEKDDADLYVELVELARLMPEADTLLEVVEEYKRRLQG